MNRATDDPRRTFPPGTQTTLSQICLGIAPVFERASASSQMVTEALFGETVQCANQTGLFTKIQIQTDGYIGWVKSDGLAVPVLSPTHRVHMLRTYAYSEPDLKSPPLMLLPLNARVSSGRTEGRFTHCERAGWVTSDHLSPLGQFEDDPAGVSERFIGTPYLWGGRTSIGLDCTGLTQMAYAACGKSIPRDSDMQFEDCGSPIADWQSPSALQRNDLVFWRGHVGIMADSQTLIHSNAHHMAVAKEELSGAIYRIARYYDRPIGARRLFAD